MSVLLMAGVVWGADRGTVLRALAERHGITLRMEVLVQGSMEAPDPDLPSEGTFDRVLAGYRYVFIYRDGQLAEVIVLGLAGEGERPAPARLPGGLPVGRAAGQGSGESGPMTVQPVPVPPGGLGPDESVEVLPGAPPAEGAPGTQVTEAVTLLGEGDPAARHRGVSLLREADFAEALDLLTTQMLQERDAGLRARMAHAFARRGEAAVPALIRLLRASDPLTRELAAATLGVIASPAAVEALGKAMDDAEPQVRARAQNALDQIRAAGPAR